MKNIVFIILSLIFAISVYAMSPPFLINTCGGMCQGNKGSENLTSTGQISESAAGGTKYTHSGGTCKINYIELNCDDGTATEFRMAIYSHNSVGDVPNSKLVEVADAIAVPSGYAWAGSAIPELTLENGVTYWFVWQANGTINYHYVATADAMSYDLNVYGTFPATWNESGEFDRLVAMRASWQ